MVPRKTVGVAGASGTRRILMSGILIHCRSGGRMGGNPKVALSARHRSFTLRSLGGTIETDREGNQRREFRSSKLPRAFSLAKTCCGKSTCNAKPRSTRLEQIPETKTAPSMVETMR